MGLLRYAEHAAVTSLTLVGIASQNGFETFSQSKRGLTLGTVMLQTKEGSFRMARTHCQRRLLLEYISNRS